MNKNLIVQLNVDLEPDAEAIKHGTYLYLKEMYDYSEKSAIAYAKKCNAEYYKISSQDDWAPGAGKHIAFQKLKVYDLMEYENILLIDSDYIIKDAPDIFNLYAGKFSACVDVFPDSRTSAKELKIPPAKYFNTGMMLLPQDVLIQTKQTVLEYINYDEWKFADQGLLNAAFAANGIIFNPLDPRLWNPAFTGIGRYADHFAGPNKELWDINRYV
jgi:alpha-N-acetylglucosamine transferase